MIPEAYIREWYMNAPWQEWGMVEQDLLISRMLVALFGNEHRRYDNLSWFEKWRHVMSQSNAMEINPNCPLTSV
jgi:hypothetical protein